MDTGLTSSENIEEAHDLPACFFHMNDSRTGQGAQVLLSIWHHDIFKIGRDPRSNSFALSNDPQNMVSRNHCEIYIVVYEPSVNHVYVRDRKSCNGTYVNNKLIGVAPNLSSGFLLQDGDIITIRPYWNFTFRQHRSPPRCELTNLQIEECKLFSDKYELTPRCLGQGAEAVVYLAVDKVSKCQLACKLVNLEGVRRRNTPDDLRRKFQEADIIRQLQHPNILPYVDAVCSPHTLYTFTELAAGGDLMSFTFRHGSVAEFDARIIIRQVVHGLRYLHAKGIVHRDLKPENILLAYSPKMAYHRVMLSDFGACAVPRRSRMITNVGTVSYQAPEFLTKSEPQTTAVDIWSLGVVTLLLLASGSDIDFGDMNRMDQKTISEFLVDSFSIVAPTPSEHGKLFVWECLRISASERMSTTQAECHDWLCLPEKHQEFFRSLDRRMMSEWHLQSQLKPMPLQLPSLLSKPPVFDSYEDPSSTGILTDSLDNVPLQDMIDDRASYHDEEAANPEEPTENQAQKEPSHGDDMFTKPELPAYAKAIKKLQRSKSKPSNPPRQLDHSADPKLVRRSSSNHKRKRSAMVAIPDVLLLPLSGLDRHLRPDPDASNSQRERVLDELKKRNAKFLVDPPAVVPELVL